jgi:hypothetical protein
MFLASLLARAHRASLSCALVALVALGACRDGENPAGSVADEGDGDEHTGDGDGSYVPPDTDAPPSSYPFPCRRKPPPSRAATFVAVYLDVFCEGSCTNSYCHGSQGAWADLDMTTIENAYHALVGRHTGQSVPVDNRETCRASSLLRVEPYEPERSILYLKAARREPCGTYMPPPSSGLRVLEAEDIDQIERWILAGAPFDTDAGADGATDDASADDAAIEDAAAHDASE